MRGRSSKRAKDRQNDESNRFRKNPKQKSNSRGSNKNDANKPPTFQETSRNQTKMSAEEATPMNVEEAAPAPAKASKKASSKAPAPAKKVSKKAAAAEPVAEPVAATEAPAAAEGEAKKKRHHKANRTTFIHAIRKIAKSVLADTSVTKAKKGFYEQVNLALTSWLKKVSDTAAKYANSRKKSKTIAMRDMYAALLTSLYGSNAGSDVVGYEDFVKSVKAVGNKNAGNSKPALVQRIVSAYGEQYNLTRTRTVRGKQVTSTLINPSRVSALFLKKTGVERVANGVANLLAYHAQVMVIEFLNEIAQTAEFHKTKTMTVVHIARAVQSLWYAKYLFGSSPAALVNIPLVVEPIVLPTKKSILEAKREGRKKWRETHAELLPAFRKQKRANRNGGEAAPAKPKSAVKKSSTSKSKSKTGKRAASKSKSRSKPAKKAASKSKSKSKPTAKKAKKSASTKKPKTAGSKIKKANHNATASKKVKA